MFSLTAIVWEVWLAFVWRDTISFVHFGGGGGGRGVGKVDCKAVSFFLKIGLVKGKINSLTEGKCASITCP